MKLEFELEVKYLVENGVRKVVTIGVGGACMNTARRFKLIMNATEYAVRI